MPRCRQDLLRDLTITRGDVVLAMRRGAAVIGQTYTTGAQEHVYLFIVGYGIDFAQQSANCQQCIHERKRTHSA